MRFLAIVVGLSVLMQAVASSPARAVTFPEGNVSPPLVVQDTSVVDAVKTLMQRYDIPVRTVSETIEGVVSGALGDVTVPLLLNRLGALHGFYWYYDGSYMELGPADEVVGETIKIAPTKVVQFRADLDRLGMAFSQFPLSINNVTGVVFMRGPESFLGIVRDLANQYQADPDIAEPEAENPITFTVNIIYGRQLAVGNSPEIESRSFPAARSGVSAETSANRKE
ncbi:MAG: hypothetical protein AAGA73_00410 [Pseudomonadota bacterium]